MANEIQKRLSENLKQIRKEKKMTQFELAEKAGISEAMVKSIETCHSWPSEKTLLQISNALHTDIYRFFIPTSMSLSQKNAFQTELKCVLKETYCAYVSEILKDI